ncbi:MAG: hypothetical protein QOC92_3373 [Acidimicrobiaceae bacterium]
MPYLVGDSIAERGVVSLALHFDDQAHSLLDEVDASIPHLAAQIDLSAECDSRTFSQLRNPSLEIGGWRHVIGTACVENGAIHRGAVATAPREVLKAHQRRWSAEQVHRPCRVECSLGTIRMDAPTHLKQRELRSDDADSPIPGGPSIGDENKVMNISKRTSTPRVAGELADSRRQEAEPWDAPERHRGLVRQHGSGTGRKDGRAGLAKPIKRRSRDSQNPLPHRHPQGGRAKSSHLRRARTELTNLPDTNTGPLFCSKVEQCLVEPHVPHATNAV